MPVRGERQRRTGVKRTSSGPSTVLAPDASLSVPAPQIALPSPSRIWKPISPPPSCRLMPIQSQPRASSGRISLDHSWSSQAWPVTATAAPSSRKVPLTASCGRL